MTIESSDADVTGPREPSATATQDDTIGFRAAERDRLLTGVMDADADSSPDDRRDRFARAAWSVVLEPGDTVAGGLIERLGARDAFELILSDDPSSLRGAVDDADLGAIRRGLDRWRPRLMSTELVRALEMAAAVGVVLLTPSDPQWPASVADLGTAAPVCLWARGSSTALAGVDEGGRAGSAVAIVGARAATGYGEHVASELAAGIATRGYAVISGGAYGIDAMAHRSALAAEGLTVAVMAGGLDRMYPTGNSDLLGRVVDAGVVLAEAPCGRAPSRWRFLARNRLLAALSQATVVVEAGWRSGSLNTANHASALGRPLGAVPGPVTSAASAGCHRLIRDQGAECITSVDDVVTLIHPFDLVGSASPANDGDDPETLRVLDALPLRGGRDAAAIARHSGLDPATVRATLARLELEGRVHVTDGGEWGSVRRSGPAD